MTTSTHSSHLDQGLHTSQFCDLSQVQEEEIGTIGSTGNMVLDSDPISKANAHYFKNPRNKGSTSPNRREKYRMNCSMDKLKEQKWEEFNNSDFIIQEELKKMRGGSDLNSFCDSLNTSAEYARIAGASSFSSGTSNGAEEPTEYSLSLKVTY